jgi:hypothetical protein
VAVVLAVVALAEQLHIQQTELLIEAVALAVDPQEVEIFMLEVLVAQAS